MEAAAGVAAQRGVSLPMPSSQSSRKEWRAVSELPARNSGNEDSDRSKLGQSDERLIYEVQQPADVDFCSITIDGSLDNDILQKRLHTVLKQREELQQIETELRAQLIARSEIMGLQSSYDSQIKEHVNANVNLQEQLREREHTIHELERKIEEAQRELHAIRLESEAVWAKDDLQNKELATFRRERDNSEAERDQHLKQIHDLQEHIREKESQFMELQEQHRVAQETIIFKDDQLREAQAWITRVQEMDALQTSTNQTLQAELRERTEQYNQLWMGSQRQFAELVHTIQQQQMELVDARERSGSYSDESHASQTKSKDASHFGQNNGSHLDDGGNGKSGNSGGLPNGNAENISSFVSNGNASGKTEHVHAVPITPQSLLGMPTYLPAGQVPALHPFVMHQQGIPHSVPSHFPQPHVGHFHSTPAAISSIHHWQNQHAVTEGSQIPMHNQYAPSQSEHNLLRPENSYDYEVSVNGQALRPEYMDVHISQGLEPHVLVASSNDGGQVMESIDKSYMVDPQPQHKLQQISSQFQEALKLDPLKHKNETGEKNVITLGNNGVDAPDSMTELPASAADISETPINHGNFSEKPTINNASVTVPPEAFVSIGQKTTPEAFVSVGKSSEITLLNTGSLLGCIVRTIPPNGRIRISSTLPNRLGKMLAPLHWHDYKKSYGKLDEFVGGHPELFIIEGDYIQLREHAHEIIAATEAFAKVAAVSVTSSYSSLLPSVAVTPMAQSHRLKNVPSMDSKFGKPDQTFFREHAASKPGNTTDNYPQISTIQNQHSKGVPYAVGGGVSTVKILSKPKDLVDINGPEIRSGQSAINLDARNGTSMERSDLVGAQSRGSIQGRTNANFAVKQQGRATGTSSSSRR